MCSCARLLQRETFVANDLHTAFKEDALASSHPLSPPQEDVQTTSEIMEMFDAITYCKVENQQSLAVYTHHPLCPQQRCVTQRHTAVESVP